MHPTQKEAFRPLNELQQGAHRLTPVPVRPACHHGPRTVCRADGELRARPQLTAFFTSATILASSAAVNSCSAKAIGHIAPSSRFAVSLKPSVAYRVLNFCAGWKKQTTLPSLAYAGCPYQSRGVRPGALAVMIA